MSSLVLESFESSSVPCVFVTLFRYQLQKEKTNVPRDISSDYSIPPIHVERFIFPPFLARIVTGFGYSYTFNHLGCSLLHLLRWSMSHIVDLIPFSSSKIVAAKACMNRILSHSRQGDNSTVTIYNS
jgi:hypothetical protein